MARAIVDFPLRLNHCPALKGIKTCYFYVLLRWLASLNHFPALKGIKTSSDSSSDPGVTV